MSTVVAALFLTKVSKIYIRQALCTPLILALTRQRQVDVLCPSLKIPQRPPRNPNPNSKARSFYSSSSLDPLVCSSAVVQLESIEPSWVEFLS